MIAQKFLFLFLLHLCLFPNRQKTYLFFFLFFLSIGNLSAQILDDSTKQVYGVSTTKYILEIDVLENKDKKYLIDSSIHKFHNYNAVQGNDNFVQDMGGFGTSLRDVFYKTPTKIGTQLGINGHLPYLFTPENVRYFDTKSPFTQVYYAQGTNGDQKVEFTFSQNINKNFNLGLYYRRFNTDKPYGAGVNANEKLWTDQISVVAFTSYQTENQKYKLLYHFSHLNQTIEELGGVKVTDLSRLDTIFGYRNSDAILGNTAESWETHNNHHLYHHLALDKGFTLFHNLDIKRQRDDFKDTGIQQNRNFYPIIQEVVIPGEGTARDAVYRIFNFNPDTTYEKSVYRLYENKIGIKGKFSGFNYIAYFKNRIYNWNTNREGLQLNTLASDSTITSSALISNKIAEGENFVGGKLFYQFNEKARLTVEAEHLLGRDYFLQGVFINKNFELGLRSVFYSPTLMQRRFASNHYNWRNSFDNSLTNEIFGKITIQTEKLLFKPFASYQIINKLIYWDTLALPRQSGEIVQITQIGLDFNYKLGKFRTENTVIYTESLGENLIRFPKLFINSRIYCEDCLYKKLLQSQIGVEMHFKSDYLADAYMPVSKQFYLQNTYLSKPYAIFDVFINFKLKSFRIFGKLSHFNQLPEKGYVNTALYPGMKRIFTFGVNWMFFD